MSNFLNALNNIIWGPPLIILMIVTGVYFTLRTKFFQVRHLGYIFSRTLGRLFHRTDESADEKGLLTPYEAIATAVGGSVGFGNIAGVATAVTTGGPGAVFWMWLTAFLGMLIKQVEVTLAVYYRRTDETACPTAAPPITWSGALAKSAIGASCGCRWLLCSASASSPPSLSAPPPSPPLRWWPSLWAFPRPLRR